MGAPADRRRQGRWPRGFLPDRAATTARGSAVDGPKAVDNVIHALCITQEPNAGNCAGLTHRLTGATAPDSMPVTWQAADQEVGCTERSRAAATRAARSRGLKGLTT